MKRAPLPARLSSAWVGLNWQMEARSSSTKSENFQPKLRLHSFASCRNASLSVSAALVESALTCEWSQPQTVTCKRQSALGPSVVICFIGCMYSRLRCPLFENEERTSLCWWNTLSIAMREKRASTSRMSKREHFKYFSRILGLEISANYRTLSNVR